MKEHEFRTVFVGKGPNIIQDGEWVKVSAFHQFLQKELLYTDTDRIVRDIAKMMKNRQLGQQQARMLHESVAPFRESLESAMDVLESMEKRYTDLKLETGTESVENLDVPVDAVLTHKTRDLIFLIDIPYSRNAVNEVSEKVETLREDLMSENSDIYYAAVNHFEATDHELIHTPEELESEIVEKAGIIDSKTVAEIFKPNIPLKESYGPGKAFLSGEGDIEFKLEVRIVNDSKVRVESILPEEALNELKNRLINSRTDLGEFSNGRFALEFKIGPDMKIIDTDNKFEDLKESIQGAFKPSVNPVLARMYSTGT